MFDQHHIPHTSYRFNISYDPLINAWTQVSSLPGTKRGNAFTFTIGNIVYVGGGKNNGLYLTDFWKYDPSDDTWKQYQDFQGFAGESAIGFSIGNTGYVTIGRNGTTRFDDTWDFRPGKM